MAPSERETEVARLLTDLLQDPDVLTAALVARTGETLAEYAKREAGDALLGAMAAALTSAVEGLVATSSEPRLHRVTVAADPVDLALLETGPDYFLVVRMESGGLARGALGKAILAANGVKAALSR